jgi:hypothetical protein
VAGLAVSVETDFNKLKSAIIRGSTAISVRGCGSIPAEFGCIDRPAALYNSAGSGLILMNCRTTSSPVLFIIEPDRSKWMS